jgi:hypothetical protein
VWCVSILFFSVIWKIIKSLLAMSDLQGKVVEMQGGQIKREGQILGILETTANKMHNQKNAPAKKRR